MVRSSDGVPRYKRISRSLQERIDAGEWSPGERLPTEAALVTEFGVNRLTIRQAIVELERAGSVGVRQGRGTFVASPVVLDEIVLDAGPALVAAELRRATGERPGRHDLTEQIVRLVPASGDCAARHLGTSLETVHRLTTVVVVDKRPHACSDYWIDTARFPDLELRWGSASSFVDVLRVSFGVTLRYRWRGFSATAAGLPTAEVLGVPVGSPLLVRDGVSEDQDGTVVCYVRRHIPGDRNKFVVRYPT